MKVVSSLSAVALALGLAVPASAQLAGLPVNYAPVGTGVTIHGDIGRGLNDASGKITSVGGGITLGLPMFQVGAGVSYWGLKDTEPQEISFGGHAAYHLPLPPSTPVSLSIVAGIGIVSIDVGTESQSNIFVPAGVVLSVDVPSTSVGVTPWISPQFRYYRAGSVGTIASSSESDFGVSGGLNITLPMGLGLSIVGDFDNSGNGVDPAFTIGGGLYYSINVPSLGGGNGM